MSTPPNSRPAGTPGADPTGVGAVGPQPSGVRPASHYELLEVPPAAAASELRQAFRRLSKRYHPDTTTLPAAQAEEAFQRLQQAYSVLSDPASRRRYDALLQGASAAAVSRAAMATPARPPEAPRAVGVRRALSGGEWFALLLLGLALVLSLVLGIGVAWARGTALVRSPSWWPEPSAASGLSSPNGDASATAASAIPDGFPSP